MKYIVDVTGLCMYSNYAVYVLASLIVAYPALGGSRGCVLMRGTFRTCRWPDCTILRD
ncbi:uncharacterized protein DS421_9g276020 [Arachis hypogaea]|nr:uncharacterized protein DS421_9g276020 [Arachis hypogaea]